MAASNGHLESVRLLLDRGAYNEAKDEVCRKERGVERSLTVQCALEGAWREAVASAEVPRTASLIPVSPCLRGLPG